MKTIITLLVLLTFALPAGFSADRVRLSADYMDGEDFGSVRILGSLELDGLVFDGLKIQEMSGLAWDKDAKLLYAITNDAHLFHLKPVFDSKGHLFDLSVKAAYKLKNPKGEPLWGGFRDSEGLVFIPGDSNHAQGRLLVSFENVHRVDQYDLMGNWLGPLPIPNDFENRHAFYNNNSGMEAIATHPLLGILTSTERPLINEPENARIIYSLDGKKKWQIPRSGVKNAAIVALESSDSGDLLVLERAYSSMFEPLVISLYRVSLDDSCLVETAELCTTQLLARFDTAKGWAIDNFEGLTHLGDDHYFMISDNNKMWFQKTLLTYFSMLPDR